MNLCISLFLLLLFFPGVEILSFEIFVIYFWKAIRVDNILRGGAQLTFTLHVPIPVQILVLEQIIINYFIRNSPASSKREAEKLLMFLCCMQGSFIQ